MGDQSWKGREAELYPESVAPPAFDPLRFPFDAWEFDLLTASPRDHTLKDGNRLDLPKLVTGSVERDVTTLSDAGLASPVLIDTSTHGAIVLSATALGADRTVDISALTVVGRELEVTTLNAHGTYQLIVDAGASKTINGYRYWYLNGAYQRVRLRQVSATGWVVLDCLGTWRRFADTSQRTKASAVSGTHYKIHASHELTLEPGKWKIRFHGQVATSCTTQTDRIVMELGLATSAAGNPINELDANVAVRAQASQVVQSFDFNTEYDIAATTTLHLSCLQNNTGANTETLVLYGNDETTVIEARRIS